ncbi:MAG: chemotaxis protein CheA, partial [Bacteriovoracaceae bacterium]
KKINLHISGEDTEVDKSLLEKMADPLVHIVRNAADHGLESSEKRLEAGKSVEGNLWLSAYHKGNFTVIEVKDDGAGIDPEVIRKKAVEKGLISADQILTDEESIELIFAPGFSTKEQVTEVSGRGVGMDVVKTNIKELRGEIKISSKMGEGSVFKIYLPLTLAIVDGMVVHAGEHRFVVPISQITESVHATQIHSIGGRKEVLSLRGKSMALYRLSSLLGYSSNDEISDQGIAMIVASEDKNKSFAVLVDDISEQQQVVIKPLSEELKGMPGITGAAILGDGSPSPILDLAALAKAKFSKVRHKRKERTAA